MQIDLKKMAKISVLIPSWNSEKTIQSTLDSIKWADEIVIVDSFSTDRTLEICKKYTDRIFVREYKNPSDQKNWAIDKCSYEWILQLDTDETIEPGLREEIEDVLKNPDPSIHCFCIPRKNFIYEKWVKGSGLYPDYQTRLFRKSARFNDKTVHESIEVTGRFAHLKHHIIHNDFKDISTWLLKIERYSRYELQDLLKKQHRLSIFDWTLRPWIVFFHRYVLLNGWQDGYRGFLTSALISFYVFLKYIKFWEYRSKK